MKNYVFLFFIALCSFCLSAKQQCPVFFDPWGFTLYTGAGKFNHWKNGSIEGSPGIKPLQVGLGVQYKKRGQRGVFWMNAEHASYTGYVNDFGKTYAGYTKLTMASMNMGFEFFKDGSKSSLIPFLGLGFMKYKSEQGLWNGDEKTNTATDQNWNQYQWVMPFMVQYNYRFNNQFSMGIYLQTRFTAGTIWPSPAVQDQFTNAGITIKMYLPRYTSNEW